MRIGFICQCGLVFTIIFLSGMISGQTVIFSETFDEAPNSNNGQDQFFTNWSTNCPTCSSSGGYYEVRSGRLEQNNSDGPAIFSTGNIDVSSCNTLRLRLDYTGLPYSGTGAGNFEDTDECNALTCAGDTDNSTLGTCFDCWDFFLVEIVYNNGTREVAEFIGDGFNPTTHSVNYTSGCLNTISSASIEVKSQTWAGDEVNTMDNIVLICNDPPNDVVIDQNPTGLPLFCVGESVELVVNNIINENFEWFDPNGNPIGGNSNSVSFAATGAFGLGSGSPQNFSVITTDGSGCKSTDDWAIIVNPSPTANLTASQLNLCEGDDIMLNEIGTGAISYNWLGPVGGSTNSSTWNITNVSTMAEGNYSVTVTDAIGCTDTDDVNITVAAGGVYTLDVFKQFCTNGIAFNLSTVQDGISGDWSGAGVISNVLEPSTLTSGIYELTFTPSASGCASPLMTSIMIGDAPTASSVSAPLQSCGGMTASFDLTSQDATINEGSGQTVVWYEDAGLMIPIPDPSNFDSPSATVYAVVNENGCNSNLELLDLLVSPDPEIMMAGQLVGCDQLTLNNINILNQSGNQAYYDEPNGMGNTIPVGTIFTSDTIIYAFDTNGSCSDEQMITVSVGQFLDAGPDTLISICAIGFIDLLDFVSPNADAGNFQDGVGNPITDNMIFADDLFGVTVQFTFQTDGLGACAPETANYAFNISEGNNAGADSIGVLCFGQVLELASFTADGGFSGNLVTLAGILIPSNQSIFYLDDNVPFEEFNYIVDAGGSCEPDTAYVRISGALGPSREVSGNVCADYSIDVNGTTYNINNPNGLEFTPSNEMCDSVINIDLTFQAENRILRNDVLCPGQEIILNQIVYNAANPTGTEILENADQFGCDSIIDVDLSFDSQVTTFLDFIICRNNDTLINGVLYDESNLTGSASLISESGCDSIVMVDLQIAEINIGEITGTFCPGDTLLIDGDVYAINRPFGMTLANVQGSNGCDSFTSVLMEFDLSFSTNISLDLCEDETITVNGTEYGASNPQGSELLSNMNTCDSLYNIDLNILKADSTYINESFCFDTSLIVNNVVYDRFNFTGEEIIAGGSVSGCRQYVFIDLEFIEPANSEVTVGLCIGDSMVVNNVKYDVNNPTGIETLLSANGCDSTVVIDLSFIGIQANITAFNPTCFNGEGGIVEIDILQDEQFLADILLDGNSVIGQFLSESVITNISSGAHEVVIQDQRGCEVLRNFTIEDIGLNKVDISSNLVNDEYYNLNASFSAPYSSLLWSPGDGLSCISCESTEARPKNNTTYYVDVIDENGCTFRDSIFLEFLVGSVLYQANIFSPNEDGVNDLFFIDSEESYPFENFMIYDRWGNNVFRNTNGNTGDSSDGWDGNGYTQGVYVYYLEIEFPSGLRTISGEVSLFR